MGGAAARAPVAITALAKRNSRSAGHFNGFETGNLPCPYKEIRSHPQPVPGGERPNHEG